MTIAFVKQADQQPPAGVLGANKFTRDSGEYVLISRRREAEAMVEAAGFPLECAPLVDGFCRRSATMAANSFWKAVSITVEMAPPTEGSGHHRLGDGRADEEDVAGEGEPCSICLKECAVGSVEAVRLPCSHAFHRECLDRWLLVKRTCPYCRSLVPEGAVFQLDGWQESDEDDDAGEEQLDLDSVVLESGSWSLELKFD